MKHYYIYMTTNNITGMKYIGKHYGELDDSYLGSGKKLKLDIDIYGKNSFTKSILFISNSEEENCKKDGFLAACKQPVRPIIGRTGCYLCGERQLALLARQEGDGYAGKTDAEHGECRVDLQFP